MINHFLLLTFHFLLFFFPFAAGFLAVLFFAGAFGFTFGVNFFAADAFALFPFPFAFTAGAAFFPFGEAVFTTAFALPFFFPLA